MASLGMVLEGYPTEVIMYVTDPKTGIQRKSKWPPTISEIVEACDEHASYLQRIEDRKSWGKRPPMIEPPREVRPTMEELKAKYGPNWGIDALNAPPANAGKPVPSWDEIVKLYTVDKGRIGHLADMHKLLRDDESRAETE